MSILRRLAYPTLLALLLTGSFAFGASAWSSFGEGCGSSYLVCVYANDSYGDPHATTNGSDSNYSGDTYYNSGGASINDSINSMQNYYTSQDVTFHGDANQSGSSFCVDSFFGYTSINFFLRDTFSSHQVGNDDSAC
jgi:hypothetical protein